MKRVREEEAAVDHEEASREEETCHLPMLLDDIFTHMVTNHLLSDMDWLMFAWAYKPVRPLVPARLRGKHALFYAAYKNNVPAQLCYLAEQKDGLPFHDQRCLKEMWDGFLHTKHLGRRGLRRILTQKGIPYALPPIKFSPSSVVEFIVVTLFVLRRGGLVPLLDIQLGGFFTYEIIRAGVEWDKERFTEMFEQHWEDVDLLLLDLSLDDWRDAIGSERWELVDFMLQYVDHSTLDIRVELFHADCEKAMECLWKRPIRVTGMPELIRTGIMNNLLHSIQFLVDKGMTIRRSEDDYHLVTPEMRTLLKW